MAYEIFSNEWARAFGEQINESPAYKKSARSWEWPVALTMRADPNLGIMEDRSIYLDLWHGDCRSARAASRHDLDAAPYVISGDAATWRQVLDRQLEPISGIMRGKLRLARGNMVTLARYVMAAKELVSAATHVETVFPES